MNAAFHNKNKTPSLDEDNHPGSLVFADQKDLKRQQETSEIERTSSTPEPIKKVVYVPKERLPKISKPAQIANKFLKSQMERQEKHIELLRSLEDPRAAQMLK